jgi:hypothetical protein
MAVNRVRNDHFELPPCNMTFVSSLMAGFITATVMHLIAHSQHIKIVSYTGVNTRSIPPDKLSVVFLTGQAYAWLTLCLALFVSAVVYRFSQHRNR